MISKNVYRFCKDDISLIENYNEAINDQSQIWECHHKLGINYSRQYLKDNNLYYNRPASELIFLTVFEHRSLHNSINNPMKGKHYVSSLKGKHLSEETKRKQSESKKGKNNPMYGKSVCDFMTDKQIKKWKENISKTLIGRVFTEEHKKKISEARKRYWKEKKGNN